MAIRARFFPRYRTVRVVPWWWSVVPGVGLGILVAWALLVLWFVIGAPGLTR